ncbi:tetratricopeptide repeat protein [Aromatoleum sp.]|uniref:tetratricopeptide repeat protein n=1 Tax=Aromatoleum sp. TaxID=2307007 RepID=UPI002FC76CED
MSAATRTPGLRPANARRPRDVRALAFVFVAISIVSLTYLVTLLPGQGIDGSTKAAVAQETKAAFAGLEAAPAENRPEAREAAEPRIDPGTDPAGHVRQARAQKAAALLAEAETLIEAGRHEAAAEVIHRAGPLAPDDPRAYFQMGRALQGKGDPAGARFYYERAIDLDPRYADAYFGFAAASDEMGDVESALGGMRSFLHVVDNPDPYRLKVAQARSAIWEWEAQLGRGPWGPTRGIPPGFTAEEVRRDGRGVGVKMQRPESRRPDGTTEYEIKAGDRFPELFKP